MNFIVIMTNPYWIYLFYFLTFVNVPLSAVSRTMQILVWALDCEAIEPIAIKMMVKRNTLH